MHGCYEDPIAVKVCESFNPFTSRAHWDMNSKPFASSSSEKAGVAYTDQSLAERSSSPSPGCMVASVRLMGASVLLVQTGTNDPLVLCQRTTWCTETRARFVSSFQGLLFGGEMGRTLLLLLALVLSLQSSFTPIYVAWSIAVWMNGEWRRCDKDRVEL